MKFISKFLEYLRFRQFSLSFLYIFFQSVIEIYSEWHSSGLTQIIYFISSLSPLFDELLFIAIIVGVL